MIWIKTTLFLFALAFTINAIEAFIENAFAHSKKSEEEYHHLYTHGLISTCHFWSTFLSILLWTALYFINQL